MASTSATSTSSSAPSSTSQAYFHADDLTDEPEDQRVVTVLPRAAAKGPSASYSAQEESDDAVPHIQLHTRTQLMVAETADAVSRILQPQDFRFVDIPLSLKTFVGREPLLKELEEQFDDYAQKTTFRVLLLHGPAGIGKTELAHHFAHKHADYFSLVYTIHAETPLRLTKSYEILAGALKINYDGMTFEEIRNSVHHKLATFRSDKHWLLIFDNLEKQLPLPSRGGIVLATSQKRLWPDTADTLSVSPFTEDEALQLFSPELLEDREACKQLIEKLEYHPMLLSKAIRSIEDGYMSVPEYLSSLQDLDPLWAEDETARYPTALGKALSSSLATLKKELSFAHEFLQLCAYFDPNQIDVSLIDSWVSQKGKPARLGKDILHRIAGLSLGTVEKTRLLIQRFLQSVLKKTQQDPTSTYVAALTLLENGVKGFDHDNPATWESHESFFLNTLALMEHPEWATVSPQGGELCAQLSNWLREVKKDPQKALLYAETACQRLNERHGEHSVEAARGLEALALWLSADGQHQKALQMHETILKIRKDALGENHPEIMRALNNLGRCLSSLNRPEEALPLFADALKIERARSGDGTLSTATSLYNMGLRYSALGQHPEALEAHRAAVEIRRQHLPANDPDVVASLDKTGNCYFCLAQYRDAFGMFEALLPIQKEMPGDNRQDVATTLDKMGTCRRIGFGAAGALQMHEEALQIRRAILKQNHPDVATTLYNIGLCLYNSRQYQKALAIHEEALTIRTTALGADHLDVAESLINIGLCHFGLCQYQKALEKYEVALKIQRESLDDHHPDVLASLKRGAACAFTLGRYKEALAMYEDVLKIQDKTPGTNPQDLAASLNNIGCCLYELGMYREALEKHEASLKIFGQETPETAKTLYNIGRCIFPWGDHLGPYAEITHQRIGYPRKQYEEAQRHYQAALTIWNKLPKHSAPDLSSFGDCLFAVGKYQEATSAFEYALALQKQMFGEHHPDVAASLIRLGDLKFNNGVYLVVNDKPRTYYEAACMIQTHTLGARHPATGASLIRANIGTWLDYGEKYVNEGIAILKETLGNTHPTVASSLFNIGSYIISRCGWGEQPKYEMAAPFFHEAWIIQQQLVGSDHPTLIPFLDSTAFCYRGISNQYSGGLYYADKLATDSYKQAEAIRVANRAEDAAYEAAPKTE